MLIYWHHWWASGCIFLIPSLQAFIYIDKIPFYLLFLLQTFFLVSGTWNFWGQVLLVKTKVEKALSVSAYSIPFVTISVLPFSSRPTFSPAFLLLQINLKEPFVLPWQIQLWVGFGFPDPITAHLDSVSIFPLGAHLFSVSFIMPEYCQELLARPCWPPFTSAQLPPCGNDHFGPWTRWSLKVNQLDPWKINHNNRSDCCSLVLVVFLSFSI